MMRRYSRREIVGYGAMGGGALLLAFRSSSFGDANAASSTTSGGSSSPDYEGAQLVTDEAEFPTRFQERPEFAEMVTAGTLPAVAERIGQDPLVLRPVRDIGTYGGRIRRAGNGGDRLNGNRFAAGPDTLLYWDYAGETIIPNLARGFEVSDDATELVLHLRRGMRWSDGQPFTADDITFWRDDINLNSDITSPAAELRVDERDVVVEKVDDHTVRYRAPGPHPLLANLLAGGLSAIAGQSASGATGGGGFAPKHYLSQFLPAYTSEAEANRLAADAGFPGWSEYFKERNTWGLNPDLPALTPWVTTRRVNDPPWELFANPYSIWVDTEGNQLPYIGEISVNVADSPDVLVLQTTAGDLDFQDRGLTVQSLPVLLEDESRGDYRVLRYPSDHGDFGIRINLAYDADAELGELLRTVEFRRALSLGVDRDQINEAFFLGTSVPTAPVCADTNPYFPGEEWRTKWATHDPEQANQLLDSIGLDAKDGAGYRLRPDGSGRIRLDYQSASTFGDFPAMGEMVTGHWAEIGIELSALGIDGGLLVERAVANQLMLSGHLGIGTDDPFVRPDAFLPTNTNNYVGMIGIPYALWFATDGAQGVEPPPELELLKEAMALREEGLRVSDDERIEIGKQLFMMHADQVWSIGGVGFGLTDGICVAKNTLRNVPERILNSFGMRPFNNLYALTFFYD